MEFPREKIVEYCRRRKLASLRLYGAVLEENFPSHGEAEALVEFQPGHAPGLLAWAELEIELSRILGHKTRLKTSDDLRPHQVKQALESGELVFPRNEDV